MAGRSTLVAFRRGATSYWQAVLGISIVVVLARVVHEPGEDRCQFGR